MNRLTRRFSLSTQFRANIFQFAGTIAAAFRVGAEIRTEFFFLFFFSLSVTLSLSLSLSLSHRETIQPIRLFVVCLNAYDRNVKFLRRQFASRSKYWICVCVCVCLCVCIMREKEASDEIDNGNEKRKKSEIRTRLTIYRIYAQ